jgi:amidase
VIETALIAGTAAALSVRGDSAVPLAAAVPPFDLDELTIAELQERMAKGELTARAIAEKYLARIASLDRSGPELRSVIELNPDALPLADALDAERKGGKVRGPLHGIPVLLKDNIDTHDRMTTTAGSLALAGTIAPRDSAVAAKLRAAGAVLLGKTNMSEWANFRSTHSSSGWSGRGGQAKNPYALDRNCSGSSSGSAAAVAANLCSVAIGSETDGSIVSPASICGITGIKPTLGLVSRAGIIPIAHSQDTAGPMTRTVSDAAAVLAAIAGADSRDAVTAGVPTGVIEALAAPLRRDALRGARIGIVRKGFNITAKADPILEESLRALRAEGAVLVDPVELETAGKYDDEELLVLLYEFKADLNAYLATAGAPVKSLADVIAFNERNREREMPYFGQELFLQAQEKGPLTSKEYVSALAKCRELSRAKGIDALMEKHRLDAVAGITGGPAWLIDLVNGDAYTGSNSTPPAVSGYPHVTVPAGFLEGLPIGLSFLGRQWSDARLVQYAYAFEQVTRARRPPRFLRRAIEV